MWSNLASCPEPFPCSFNACSDGCWSLAASTSLGEVGAVGKAPPAIPIPSLLSFSMSCAGCIRGGKA